MLLRDALENSGRVAIVKVAMRQRESLAALRVRDGVLVLHTMLWPDEIRSPDFGFLDEDVEVRPQELAMAESLIESMAGDFDPGEFTDDYREALEAVIEAKVEGRDLVPAPDTTEDATSAQVVDLVAALQASIDAAKSRRARPPSQCGSCRLPAKAAAKPVKGAAAKKLASKPGGKKVAATKTDGHEVGRREDDQAGRGRSGASEKGRQNSPIGLKRRASGAQASAASADIGCKGWHGLARPHPRSLELP